MWDFLKLIFQKPKPFLSPIPSPIVAPQSPSPATSPTPPVQQSSAHLPTREEVGKVIEGMIEGTIETRLGALKNIRETQGDNRSPEIDKLICGHGGALGESYCQYGQQEILDDLCKYYKIDRKKLNLPIGGSTQQVWNLVPREFKRQEPDVACWVTWQHSNGWVGHVGMCLTKESNGHFRTFEFNTSLKADGSVERNGQGASYCSRSVVSTGNMKIRGYTDVYTALIEAMKA